MIRAFIAACLLCQALNAQQQETQATDTTKQNTDTAKKAQTGSDPKSTGNSVKDTSSKQTTKKNVGASKHPPETVASPPRLSVAAQAATDSVTALDSAIRLVTANGEKVSKETSAKLAELRAELGSADPKNVAREAAKWTAQVYQVTPMPMQREPGPTPQSSRPAVPIDPTWVLLLVSLTSPLICIGGFWFGSRVSDHNLRRHLREAGLL